MCGLFGHGMPRIATAFAQLTAALQAGIPALGLHLARTGVAPETYAAGWLMTLFSSVSDRASEPGSAADASAYTHARVATSPLPTPALCKSISWSRWTSRAPLPSSRASSWTAGRPSSARVSHCSTPSQPTSCTVRRLAAAVDCLSYPPPSFTHNPRLALSPRSRLRHRRAVPAHAAAPPPTAVARLASAPRPPLQDYAVLARDRRRPSRSGGHAGDGAARGGLLRAACRRPPSGCAPRRGTAAARRLAPWPAAAGRRCGPPARRLPCRRR